jgi:lysophospholipid acyltransferase (LPLAT)-like uncharacterized protein
VNRPVARLAVAVLPRLYVAYMRFVFATSRVEGDDFGPRLRRITEEHDGAVALLWHEEVFTVAYGYGVHAGLRAHTLASAGDAGEVVTRMLELCHFQVFRGGSTRHRSRRRPAALLAMVKHMKENPRVLYGMTVDGSRGPAYRMKPGGLILAAKCGKPVALVRTWYRRHLRWPSWDRTAIPLPWNVIRYDLRGPYHVGDAARDPEARARILLALEAELVDMAAQSYAALGQDRPPRLLPRGQQARATALDPEAGLG